MVQDMGITFSWVGFFVENLPYELLNALVSFTILHFFGSRELERYINAFRNSAACELEALGSMSMREKKTLLLALVALLAFATESLHSLPGYYAFCAVVLLGFTPIFNLLSTNDLKEVQFPILFFIVGCMAIGTVAGELGLPAWLAQNLQPFLEQFNSGPLVSLFAYWTGYCHQHGAHPHSGSHLAQRTHGRNRHLARPYHQARALQFSVRPRPVYSSL